MKQKLLVKCPVCGFENLVKVDTNVDSSLCSFFCNEEEAGCGAHLVFTYVVNRQVTTSCVVNLPFPS